MLERLHTLEDLQASLKVSISTLRRAIKSGELAHLRAGKRGQIRISEEAVQAYLERMSKRGGTVHPPAASAAPPLERGGEVGFPVREGYVGKNLSYRIINADVRVGLRSLASESVDCAITSPAYFWQRDYEVDGQLGHEATIDEYVGALVEGFNELKRVLRNDGTFFLNIGDAYYNAKGKPHGKDRKHTGRQLARAKLRAVDGPGLGLPRKSLIGLPWRVALAMQVTGWTLRSAIIWQRPGCLGEPTAHDRPHRTYEHVFVFVKSVRYHFKREGLGNEEDIWSIAARPGNSYSHCAPFPIELVDRCLGCGCPGGGVVLDPFLGSGTTAVAALRSGRSVVGVELNPNYCELAETRIREETQSELPVDASNYQDDRILSATSLNETSVRPARSSKQTAPNGVLGTLPLFRR